MRTIIRISLMASMAVVLSIAAASSVQAEEPEDEIDMVLLGDSYLAGNGAGDYWPEDDCHRSCNNGASRYADVLRADGYDVNFDDLSQAACSGAVSDYVITGQEFAVDADKILSC